MNDKEKKNKIIEQSLKLVMERGLRITMDEIAEDQGISKKTIYKFFSSRSELIDAIIDYQMSSVKDIFKNAFYGKKDIIDGFQEIFTKIPEKIGLISKRLMDDLQRYEPEKWERIDNFRTKMLKENFPKLFAEGIKSGYFRKDINMDILLLLYISAIQSIINPTILSQSSFSAKDVVFNLMKIIYLGITTDKGRNKIINIFENKLEKGNE